MDGQDIPMSQFYSDQDLTNVQTEAVTEESSNQKLLEMIMRRGNRNYMPQQIV